MSLLIGAVWCTCAVLIATVTVAAANNAVSSGRARTAADAAALAAVAESGPFGGGRPQEVARRYATANGGRLVSCRCAPGATVMEVVVEVGSASSRARAAYDPAALAPAVGASTAGLHPALADATERLVRASGGRVRLVSGYRSSARQTELWERALASYGGPSAASKWVAPPGRSMHERGLAVDLGGDIELAVRLIDELSLPLYRPLAHEPWHFELVGSRD